MMKKTPVNSDLSPPGSSWALIAFAVLLTAAVSGQVFQAPAHLYPYGPGAGDTTSPVIDDGSSGEVPVSPPSSRCCCLVANITVGIQLTQLTIKPFDVTLY